MLSHRSLTAWTASAVLSSSLIAVAPAASAHPAASVVHAEPVSCPFSVDSDFVDSWGDARSGGRRHQGVDMPAPLGTPVVAVRAGFAEFKVSGAGGNAIWLTTTDGDKYYYAHLDGWEGDSRLVGRGEVVGYVGSTGNAKGDHLHIESHPGGQPANPYPTIAEACAPSEQRSGTPSLFKR